MQIHCMSNLILWQTNYYFYIDTHLLLKYNKLLECAMFGYIVYAFIIPVTII